MLTPQSAPVSPPSSQQAKSWFPGAALAVAVCLLFIAVARNTPTDTDEGYFVLAGELVANGRLPYRDFFYPQAPLLPFLWAAIDGLGLHGFVVGRTIMGGCAAAIALLTMRLVRARTRSVVVSGLAGLFVFAHELGWQWLAAIKTYGPATLFALAALSLVCGTHPPKPAGAAIAGALAVGAVGCRLLFAPLLVIVPLATLFHASWHGRGHDRPRLLSTVACILSASILMGVGIFAWAHACWRPFLFGNLGYHSLRSTGGLFGSWPAKKAVFLAAIGLNRSLWRDGSSAQFFILWTAAVVGVFLSVVRTTIRWWLVTALALSVANAAPNPVHQQYFCGVVPFLAVAAAVSLHGMGQRLALPALTRPLLFGGIGLIYVALFAPGWRAKCLTGIYGAWDLSAFRPTAVQDRANKAARLSRAHPGPILAFWPGTVIGVPESVLTGFENQFGRVVAEQLRTAERQLYRVRTTEEAVASVRKRQARLVFLDRDAPTAPVIDALKGAGYRLLERWGPRDAVYLAPNAPPSP